jgi:hypothetical protein
MRRAWIAIATVLAVAAAASPAVAMPDARNARPRILSAELTRDGARATVTVVGRDRDDVVRGAEISWGDGRPSQGLSACSITRRGDADRRRRGAKERFRLSYDYPAAGRYTVTVRVYSGGCGERPMQRSRQRTLSVRVG